MLNIITAPNPVLSQSAKRVLKIDKAILKLLADMEEALLAAKDPEGVGLAAPQIGRSLRIFLAKPTPKSSILVFINPKITANEKHPTANKLGVSSQKSEATKLEGCLSLPSIWGEVNRSPQITLSYMDTKGNPHKRIFKGFLATVIQHETDHLNGILFPKKVLEQKGKLYKSRKNKKGEDVFEEIEL